MIRILKRPTYPSDLTDDQWRQVEILLPEEKLRGRNRTTSLREVVNAINYRWRTGCVWRMLPHDFPQWATVYTYYRQWQRDGVLRKLRDVLLRPVPSVAEQSSTSSTQPSDGQIPGAFAVQAQPMPLPSDTAHGKSTPVDVPLEPRLFV